MAATAGTVDAGRGAARLVPWTALATAAVAVLALGIGITTPPRSGPNCRSACIGFPYTGGARFVPRDFLWMYPASLLPLLVLALTVVLPRRAGTSAAAAGRMSTALTAISAGVLVTDYGLQLTVVQPMLVKGETQGLGLISQYNPHGVFIGLEDVGYLLLAVALAALAAALQASTGRARAARAVLAVGAALAVVALVGLGLAYGSDLEYRFEVAGLAIDWLTLIVAGFLLA